MARPAGALQLARLNERQLAVTKTFQEFFALDSYQFTNTLAAQPLRLSRRTIVRRLWIVGLTRSPLPS